MDLLIGDLHLTDKARDAYRFDLFKWVVSQQHKHSVDRTFIMGDLTDSKDRHPAPLVNRIVSELVRLKPPVYVLMGNHDYIDSANPFFKFLNEFETPVFIVKPSSLPDRGIAMCPHIRDETVFAAAIDGLKEEGDGSQLLLIHNTITGAIAESGGPLSGFSAAPIERLAPRLGCYAGDVHRPQHVGCVTYVGAPYHIRFGDDFEPRCLLLHDGKSRNLYFEAPRKWSLTIREADDLRRNDRLLARDQVKLTLELAREEVVDWKMHKKEIIKACQQLGLELYGLILKTEPSRPAKKVASRINKTPQEILTSFCIINGVGTAKRDTGLQLLSDV